MAGGKRRRNTGEAAKKRAKIESQKQDKVEIKTSTGNSKDTENVPSAELIQEAKYYLESWQKHANVNDLTTTEDEPKWRFKKAKQVWVLRWMYRADVVNKSLFSIVLEYLTGMQGTARERVLRAAQDIVEEGEPAKTSEDTTAKEENKEQTLAQKLHRRRLKRALQIAKVLS